MTDIDDLRSRQLAREEKRYARLATILRETCAPAADWAYQPPRSDNWLEWCNVAKFCAAELRYRQAGETYGLLATGHGPYYCPACETRPEGKGWIGRLCLECWFFETGHDQALRCARAYGRLWVEQTRRVA